MVYVIIFMDWNVVVIIKEKKGKYIDSDLLIFKIKVIEDGKFDEYIV